MYTSCSSIQTNCATTLVISLGEKMPLRLDLVHEQYKMYTSIL